MLQEFPTFTKIKIVHIVFDHKINIRHLSNLFKNRFLLDVYVIIHLPKKFIYRNFLEATALKQI